MPAGKNSPNIVLVVLDTQRLDRLGCYGYQRDTSPNLDAFAREATIFEKAISPAQWTIPAHASLFSGEIPSIHMTVQAGDVLPRCFKTLAGYLRSHGYRTVGFCNNPLVGVINNGLKRGFDTFYNYAGAIPSVPVKKSRPLIWPLKKVWEYYTQLLRKIAYPIQNGFANSGRMFQAALNPFWVPLWTRFARFKGNTQRSIQDVTRFVSQRIAQENEKPYFIFFNLLETHLPFSAPDGFVRIFAPQVQEERAARDFIRAFNTQAVRWITPLEEPLPDLEAQTLSGMYDAEVAYQDHHLAQLLAVLDQPYHRANTMVVFVSDHGEMLGEHRLMGHAYGVYQALVHVPLLIRFPEQVEGRRVANLVSTTHLFHTALDVAGIETYQAAYNTAVDVKSQSLLRDIVNPGKPYPAVYSEAYAPEFALRVAETHRPHLIEKYHCRATRRAVYEGPHKLIRIEGVRDELFATDIDPSELHDLLAAVNPERRQQLTGQLERFLKKARARRPAHRSRTQADLDNKVVRQRLRDLGYIE